MINNLFIHDSSNIKHKNIPSQLSTVVVDSDEIKELSLKRRIFHLWERLSLRRKSAVVALAIGVLPVATVGGVAYHVASNSLMKQIVSQQENRTFEIRQKIALVTNHLISDATAIASSPLLADLTLSDSTSIEQKVALLDNYLDTHYKKYDSIGVFDLDGNLLFQSKSALPLDPEDNYSNRDYFQRAIATKTTAVNNPSVNPASGNNTLEVATPIKEQQTGVITGVVRIRMPLDHWQELFSNSKLQGFEHKIIDSEGQIFAADEKEMIGQDAGVDLSELPLLQKKVQSRIDDGSKPLDVVETGVMLDKSDDETAVVSVASISEIPGVLEPNWQLALSRSVDEAFAPLTQLRWTLLLGTTTAALSVGSLAAFLAHRATLPILAAAGAVKKIGRGDLNARVDIQGKDELAMLGTDINKMAMHLKSLVLQKDTETLRYKLLKDLTLKLSGAIDSKAVARIAVEEIISMLKVDRAIVYRQEREDQGIIVAEAVKSDRISRLEDKEVSLNYLHQYLISEESDRVRVVNNIYKADLKLPHLRQLEACEVKSELSAPLFVGQKFRGFLVVQQCDRPRTWQQTEIDFFAQLASQVMLAKERTDLLIEQKAAKEQLQKEAIELLMEVEPISKGDLTIRATVADGAIGTLADSYNATVESLRHIVTQVQQSVTQMAATTNNNGEIAQSLSERASEQSKAVASALQQIQAMTESIQAVALNAEQVEIAFQEVSDTVTVGSMGMDRTVEGIFAIRETVAETAKKVKRLGESSQKISKVVNLINSFADRTNLLALNASLEASRAGQEGQSFAIVAEEVQTMARQSAEATTEIEKLVASIQLDTKEVATAMEHGTEQVVAGTKLVDETRQKLNKIAASSTIVGDRLKKITLETTQQSQVSQYINQTIAEVATMATTTSVDAIEVSASTQELLDITDKLQESANKFKV